MENNGVGATECADANIARSTSDALLNIRNLFEARYLASSSPSGAEATGVAAAAAAAAAAGPSTSSVEHTATKHRPRKKCQQYVRGRNHLITLLYRSAEH